MTVNSERIEKLTTALRSGEFSQGIGMLRSHSNDTYCCLGVACEVYRRETGDGDWQRASDTSDYTKFVPEHVPGLRYPYVSDVELPEKVREWYGFNGSSPIIKITNDKGIEQTRGLVDLNDDEGYTFEQIADVIEANFTQ